MKRILSTVVLAALTLGTAQAQEQEKAPAAAPETPAPAQPAAPMANPFAMTPALEKTFNNPISMCAACHSGEDMARYEKLIGPMMAMMNPANWMNPGAYTAMMAPMMDPNVYTQWMNAYMKKYGMYFDPNQYMAKPQADAEKK